MTTPERPGTAVNAELLQRFGSQAMGQLRAAFDGSRHPMLIADDRRRWVCANASASELLGIAPDEIPWRTMDEVTAASGRNRLKQQWDAFLNSGAAEGWYDLEVSGAGVARVEFSAIANALPGRHLTVFIPPDVPTLAHSHAAPHQDALWEPVPARDRVQLTNREREVMTLVAAGGQSAGMAERLFLSPETVKTHVQNAMTKLDARTRAHAVAIALVTGQIMWSVWDGSPPGQARDELPPDG
jgi:DNA-binding CsgD family transcriptional regulator